MDGNKPSRTSSGRLEGPERDSKRRRSSSQLPATPLPPSSSSAGAPVASTSGHSLPTTTTTCSGAQQHQEQQQSQQGCSQALFPTPTCDVSSAGASAPAPLGQGEAGGARWPGGTGSVTMAAPGEGGGGGGAAATPAGQGQQGQQAQGQGQQGSSGGRGKGKGKGKGKRAMQMAEATAEAAAAAGVGNVRVEGKAGKGLGKDVAGLAVAAGAGGGYYKPEVVNLPLEIGSRVYCKWRNGEFYRSKVIERRVKPGVEVPEGQKPDPKDYEYYMHYFGFNRRMDEWVQLEQMDLSTVEVELPDPDPKKKKKAIAEESDSDHGDFDPNALREHEEFTKVKNIDQIELGRHLMDTWYFSPFPPEYRDCKKLYFCEYTLQFFKQRSQLMRHLSKVRTRHPPGDEIYRNGNVCMFEVDGKKEKTFSQNLCYLAKLFLDHKTLYYDVDLFLFYVLCEIDERGAHVVGYFSKEKASEDGYNLACILTLPAYQRKGYGKFLISMSYELSKIEGKVGTPERPLSDLGRVSYHGYWTRELLMLLAQHEGTISIKDLSQRTAIKQEDVHNTLQQLGMMQYQKGQHVICAAPAVIERQLKAAGGPGLVVDPSKIVWTPYNAEREYAHQRQ